MRKEALLIACMLLAVFSLVQAGNEIVFEADYESIENSRVIYSTNSATAAAFQLGGVEMEDANLAQPGYTSLGILAANPKQFGCIGEEGMPDLPLYSECIIIPDRSGVSVNIISSEYQTISDVDIAPLQPFTVEGSDELVPFTKNMAGYSQDEFYPGELVEISEPMIIRDFRFVNTIVYPVQYNPVTREMRVYTSIEYELVYEGLDDRNVKIRRDDNISEAFLPIYKNIFANAEEVLSDYNVIRGGYLILTPENYNFDDTIAVFGRWKHLKGYSTVVATESDINPGGSPTTTQIFNYIQNAYNTWDIPPEYVLIVGDAENDIPDYGYGSYASDHPYSLMDGDDFISDILVARMAVDDMTELRTVINKILKYEQTPNVTHPGWWKRGLGVAGNIYATSPRLANLWVRELAMDHGYTQVDTVFDWGSGCPNWSTINTAINNGVSYVSYRGWAGPSGWYNPSYHTSDIYSLRNDTTIAGIMVSVVCGTGSFGSSDCFGEAWLRAGTPTIPRGGVSFYGSTDPGTHTAWNNPNLTGFFWALFEQDMYHFAQLVVMGKMGVFNTFPRFTGEEGYVEKYFNTYNSLGDPALSVRTEIPQSMTVTYPSSIPVGTNFLTVNATDGGFPLENAYVNLVKGYEPSEEIYAGDWTDASGNVTLHFDNTDDDTIFVTVTARDYIPHIGQCLSTAQTVALGADSTAIDDDNSGGSDGNSDGNANPGEILGINVRLHNYGSSQNATGITADLSSSDSRATVTTSHQTYPNIASGSSAFANGQFIVELDGNIPHGEVILLDLSIDANEADWDAVVALEINSIKPISVNVSYPGDPNNQLDPGGTSDMVLFFQNAGGLAGENITGVLSCLDSYITINSNTGNFGNVDIGGTGQNATTPFNITVNDSAFNGRNVNFTINFTADMIDMDDILFEASFSQVIGTINSFDPSGPDDYGYYVYDNTDISFLPAPVYNWIEINSSLNRVAMPDTDDVSVLYTLPFTCQYYGENYTHMIVCTNGFVAFDTNSFDVNGTYWYNWENWPIPDPGNARAQISPFWDDLVYDEHNSHAGVFAYHDAANGWFIIEWSEMTHSRTGSSQTFEMIIYDPAMHPTPTGDCEIVFQYNVVNNDDYSSSSTHPESYSSVGFENWDQNDGIQYEYDNTYHPGATVLQAGLAIKITTAVGLGALPDMSYSPSVFNPYCEPGQQVEDYLIINNDGDGYLHYSVASDMFSSLTTNRTNTLKPVPAAEIKHTSVGAKKHGIKPVNPPLTLDSGGPDTYGYTWEDSNEPGGPVYNWVDITTHGSLIPGMGDETMAGPYSIGFTFNYYGTDYNSFYVNSNGYVSFSSTSTTYENGTIPNISTPNNMLAVYWDDLNFNSGGNAYFYTNNSDSCVISYVDVPHYHDDGSFTFEIILLSSGKIVYQYSESSGPDVNQATVGIENSDGTDGLMVCYNQPYITSGLAINFISSNWLWINKSSSQVAPHTSDTVTVTCDATELEEGIYEGMLYLQSNDRDIPSANIPIHFTVSTGTILGSCCDDETGDCVDSVLEADCPTESRFTANTLCIDLDPPCEAPVRGSCCNDETGDCVDDVLEADCPAESRFTANTLCIDLDPPCEAPVVGSCCDNETGDCVDDILEADCPTENRFTANTLCADLDPPCGVAAGYYYMAGDVNQSLGLWIPRVIGGDVTFLVNYFKGSPTSVPCLMYNPAAGNPYFWAGADANGDCIVMGSDVIKLVGYFRGAQAISWCADYLPLWHPVDPAFDPPPVDPPTGWPNCETPPVMGKIIPAGSTK
ncbi:MAG: hypothetical protein J7K40_08825 [candidate division Zixibacteria bacterium]|nr:hypothetical protein [candidate division Zixibacteria bacterium]